jgi:N-acylneuraminate cytidylyltransferase
MKVVAVIPARGGSKGIPGKNIKKFCGKPLLAWTIEHCLAALPKDDIYVSSDDEKILDVAEKCGVCCVRRPSELATDTASTEDAILHAIDWMALDLTIVYPQVTSPLRYPCDIARGITAFQNGNFDSLFSAVPLTDPCIWDININSITYDYRTRARRQDRIPYLLENGSFYIFKRGILEKYNNRLGGKIGTYMMKPFQAHEIDEPDDLILCEHFMRTKILKKG